MEDQDFSFLNVDVEDAQELKCVETGWQGAVTIHEVQPNPEKHFVQVIINLEGEDFTKKIRHPLFYPKPDDDADKRNNKLLSIRRFFEGFGIEDAQRTDPESWVGLSTEVILRMKQETYNDETYDVNVIKQYGTR